MNRRMRPSQRLSCVTVCARSAGAQSAAATQRLRTPTVFAPGTISGDSTRTAVANLSQHAFDTDGRRARVHALRNGLGDIYPIDLDAPGFESPCAATWTRMRGVGDKHSLPAR